jgi:FixJ family two-component response regulator
MPSHGNQPRSLLVLDVPVVSIVDDDRSVRSATQTLLRSLGYRAPAFASAEAFLNSPEVDLTDCLILDVQMPGMSGIDLQRMLANRSRKVPIIFITAFPDDRVRQQALAGGAVCFLTKPCDGDRIVECLEAALAQRA